MFGNRNIATRVGIIEKLQTAGFLKLSGKFFEPTEKAKMAAKILPEEFIYPDTTTNDPDLTTLKNIAHLFGCSVDFLLEFEDQDNFADPVELLNLIQKGKT